MAAMKESGDREDNADVPLPLARAEKAGALLPGQTALELRVDTKRQGLTRRPIPLMLHGDPCRIEETERCAPLALVRHCLWCAPATGIPSYHWWTSRATTTTPSVMAPAIAPIVCSVHSGDNQRSLSVDPETGQYTCPACGTSGTLREF